MAPYSLLSALLLTQAYRSLVKSRALSRAQCSIWDVPVDSCVSPPSQSPLCISMSSSLSAVDRHNAGVYIYMYYIHTVALSRKIHKA